jgi:transcriptional regulator with XRE-family HTH domain
VEQLDTTMLARNLRRARKAAGLTQVQLSEKAQKSPNTVSTLESAKVLRPHLGTIIDLADALNVAPEDLIGDAATPKGEGAQLENGQRRAYPYPWMSTAFSDLLSTWKKAAEAGYAPEHCRIIAAAALDAIDAVKPPLASMWNALPEEEKREREELRRELIELSRDAFDVYEQSAGAGTDSLAEGSNARHDEGIREEIRRLTKAIA